MTLSQLKKLAKKLGKPVSEVSTAERLGYSQKYIAWCRKEWNMEPGWMVTPALCPEYFPDLPADQKKELSGFGIIAMALTAGGAPPPEPEEIETRQGRLEYGERCQVIRQQLQSISDLAVE